MPAAAHLATIRLLVGTEPVLVAPTSSDGLTLQSRRVIQITFTRRRNLSNGIATAVAAVATVASLGHGLRQMAARPGVTWKAPKVVRCETARISLATILKTGTTR